MVKVTVVKQSCAACMCMCSYVLACMMFVSIFFQTSGFSISIVLVIDNL